MTRTIRPIAVSAELLRICYVVSLVTNTRYNSQFSCICQVIWQIAHADGQGLVKSQAYKDMIALRIALYGASS